MNKPNIFKTQSLYIAAFCVYNNMKLVGMERDGRKVTMVFEGLDAERKALEFYSRGIVEAQRYSECFRSLKDQIFER